MLTTGVVKWFNETKKFGFITMADGKDVFFHISGVISKLPLPEGQAVEFDVIDSTKGIRAVSVVKKNA